MIASRIGHTEVFDAAVDELLSELPFEFRVSSVLLANGRHIVAILDLFFLLLTEPIEVLL